MNRKINFADSQIPKDKIQAIKNWFIISGILAIGTIVFIAYKSMNQLRYNATLAHELQRLQKKLSYLENIPSLANESDDGQKNRKIIRIKQRYDNPARYLRIISHVIPDQVMINTLQRETNKQVSIIGTAKTMHAVNQFVQGLKKAACFETCAIKEMDPQDDGTVIYAIIGQIQKG